MHFIASVDSDIDLQEIPLILAFDNIDHIEIESFNCDFPKIIKKAIDSCKYILDNMEKTKAQIHCIFCLRDANFSLVNRQLEEIVNVIKIPIDPIRHEIVMSKRIEIAKVNGVKIDEHHEKIIDVLFYENKKHSSAKISEYTRQNFLPLFNFNYRKLIEFIFDINRSPLLEDSTLNYIIKLSEDSKSIHGARGIIYFWLIDYLRNKDYLKQTLLLDDQNIPEIGKANKGRINPARMLLTIIHNMNRFSLDTKYQKHYISNYVHLYDLFEKYTKIFTKDVEGKHFFYLLKSLFLCFKNNCSHLISFVNKEVFREDAFDSEIKLLSQAKSGNIELIEAKNELNKIELRINPSGFIYLYHIMRHFEFFSLIRAHNSKPLFCHFSFKKDGVPEFMEVIESTFIKVKEGINELSEFGTDWNVEEFLSSEYCFKIYEHEGDDELDMIGVPRLYLIRIIHTLVRYIDILRYCVLERDFMKEEYVKIGCLEDDYQSFKASINEDLLKKISEHIDLLPDSDEYYYGKGNLKSELRPRVIDYLKEKSDKYQPIFMD
jgi:hypothetical protein